MGLRDTSVTYRVTGFDLRDGVQLMLRSVVKEGKCQEEVKVKSKSEIVPKNAE